MNAPVRWLDLALTSLVVGIGLVTLGGCGGSSAKAAHTAPGGFAVKVISNLPYTTASCPGRGTQVERADVYLPEPQPARPEAAVVLIHGGGFVEGSKTMVGYPSIARQLAREGWAAFSIDYCLPPASPLGAHPGYPTELENVEAAVRWVRGHAVRYHVDATKVALWGGSAGATLALEVGTVANRGTGRAVAATVGWSGGYDLVDVRGASTHSIDFVWDYVGCDPAATACRPAARQASAALHPGATSAPSFLASSTHEATPGVPLYQLRDMAAALARAKVPTRTLIMAGARHAVEYTDVAYCPTIRFLETFLGPIRGSCVPPSF